MILKDKVALITGAASGIGKAIAKRFCAEGAYVILCDIDASQGKQLEKELNARGETAKFYLLDITSEMEFKKVFETFSKNQMPVDIVVNNAGIGRAGTVIEQTEEEWDLMMNTNAKGAFFGCKYGLRHMLQENKQGSIVNIASVAGLVGVLNRAGYCASKAAIVGLTKSIAIDFANSGIRVNSISPGTIDSPWIQKILADNKDPEKARKAMEERQPIGRMGTPEEVANVALFLASDEATFITGANYIVDGGITAQ